MSFATRGNLGWLGMILSGVALGAYVFTAWPDTSPRVIRLPYGEVMPKTPRPVVAARKAEVVAAPARPSMQPTVAAPAAAPVPVRAPESRPPAEEVAAHEQSADELGAQPLPGSGQAQSKPAAQKQAAAAPAQQAPAAEPASEPQPAPEEPPMLEIIVGSAPPSGPE